MQHWELLVPALVVVIGWLFEAYRTKAELKMMFVLKFGAWASLVCTILVVPVILLEVIPQRRALAYTLLMLPLLTAAANGYVRSMILYLHWRTRKVRHLVPMGTPTIVVAFLTTLAWAHLFSMVVLAVMLSVLG